MALQTNQPRTFQLKVATAKVKKQVKDGPLFFILPPLLVIGVIVFCYVAPAPLHATADKAVGAAPAAAAPVEQAITGVVYDESAAPMEESTFIAEEEEPMADAEYQDFEEEVDEPDTEDAGDDGSADDNGEDEADADDAS